MALPSFCKETIQVSRAPLVRSRGTSERDWASAKTHEVAGCSVQFGSTSTDRTDPRDAIDSTAALFAPPGADILAGDRIACASGVFAVQGEPMPRTSPTGAVSHVECALERWEG